MSVRAHEGKLSVASVSPQPPPRGYGKRILGVCLPAGRTAPPEQRGACLRSLCVGDTCGVLSVRGGRICSKTPFTSSLCIQSVRVSVSHGHPPPACALAKLSCLVASPCRNRTSKSVRAWTWAARGQLCLPGRQQGFNGNESVNRGCGR